ncbi:MAG: TATA-box-binding protein [Thermoplasmata archaeon]|nr:MAG: TATA-box-binding protein [Thermoplasmata archaeon]
MEIKIENVVASATAGGELDLQKLATSLKNAEYDPERFPGLIYRVKEPKTALLLFSSGKMVCTGAKSVEEAKEVVRRVVRNIKELGMDVSDEPEIEIQNIVATSELNVPLNLNNIAITLGLERVEYEPEQFPGLVYRVEKPKVVALLFGSGKIVCTGARNEEEIREALDQIVKELTDSGFL